MKDSYIVFVINLLQDVGVIRPIAYMAHQELGLRTLLLVTQAFKKRDSAGTWQHELDEIAAQTNSVVVEFGHELEALQALDNKSGLLIAASESSLNTHKQVHDLLRIAPSRFLKVTLQHGFECVGFIQSRDQNLAHGRNVTFAADVICSWFSAEKMTEVAPSQLHKLHHTGPTFAMQTKERSKLTTDLKTMGIVCENMHSPRLNVAGNFKKDFLEVFEGFCKEMLSKERPITLRPHPGGQYTLKNEVQLTSNVVVNNLPIYKVDLSTYAYGISAPSSILIDMVLAGIPVAVWQDSDGVMDLGNYDGLTRVSNEREWISFANAAILRPESFLAKQNTFIKNRCLDLTKEQVKSNHAELALSSTRNNSTAYLKENQKERIVFVVGEGHEVLETVFLNPLKPKIDSEAVSVKILHVTGLQSHSLETMREGVFTFHPTLIVFCNYSGSHAKSIWQWASEHSIPSILYTDEYHSDLHQANLTDAGQTDTDSASRDTLIFLLGNVTLICTSTSKLGDFFRERYSEQKIISVAPQGAEESQSESGIRSNLAIEKAIKAAHVYAKLKNITTGKLKPANLVSHRILYVANDVIPTLQLSFMKPLNKLLLEGALKSNIITEQAFKSKQWKTDGAATVCDWLRQQIMLHRPTEMIFCRYSGPYFKELLELAREFNVSTIFHIDDDLLNIPIDIGLDKYKFHNSPARLGSINFQLNNVDLVYCSTKLLKQRLLDLEVKRPIVAGDIYCSSQIVAFPVAREVSKIGYMGIGHKNDFESIIPAIVRYMREFPHVEFEVFGTIEIPDELAEFKDRVRKLPKIDSYESYLQSLSNLNWDIGVCPLTTIHFNLMKANTKWVEYTAVGTAVIASKDTVYDECCDDGCGILASTEDEWYDAFVYLTLNPELRLNQVIKAQKKLAESYSIERLRQQVLDVISQARELKTQSKGFGLN
ncbi:MAG: hypothetical protein CFE39_05485 [Comamonadaceae bacterium PBBC2]|nr:MAG: hypothetical protein CFE39_05485 [Comamonadaceae bacterium PBBC2]